MSKEKAQNFIKKIIKKQVSKEKQTIAYDQKQIDNKYKSLLDEKRKISQKISDIECSIEELREKQDEMVLEYRNAIQEIKKLDESDEIEVKIKEDLLKSLKDSIRRVSTSSNNKEKLDNEEEGEKKKLKMKYLKQFLISKIDGMK